MIFVPVTDTSQVAEARRMAAGAAERAGFTASETGRVAIVTTELATNLIKHGGGGEILVGTYEDADGSGIEVLALDRGAGIANLQACLADGYSSAGSAGNGLGAVFRQSHLIEVASVASFEIRMSGGEHSTEVIRQRQQRAHRNVCLTTRSRRHIVGCRCRGRRRSGYSTFPTVR